MNDSISVTSRHGTGSTLGSERSRTATHARAKGLAGSSLEDRFCFWRGTSGRRYVFSVYKNRNALERDALPRFKDAVVIAAELDGNGSRRIVGLGQTGSLPELMLNGSAAGPASELHFHVLAVDSATRQAILKDLKGAGAPH